MVTVVSTQPHHSVVKEIVCRFCGSTLQYVPRDVKEKWVSDYTGHTDKVNYIDCPTCSTQLSVRT